MKLRQFIAAALVASTSLFAVAPAFAAPALADEAVTLTATEIPMAPAYPVLQMGATGEAVTALQTRMATLGFMNDAASGNFDMNTKNAVKSFQRAVGFAADGIATAAVQARLFADDAPYMQDGRVVRPTPAPTIMPETRSVASGAIAMPASFLTLRLGTVGVEVGELQRYLIALPETMGGTPGLTINARFDYDTKAAVERYQTKNNLTVDGIASAQIQRDLIERLNALGITEDRLPTAKPTATPTPKPTAQPTPTPAPGDMDAMLMPDDADMYLPPIELDSVYSRASLKYACKANVDYKVLITAGSYEDAFEFKRDGSKQYYPLMYGNREYTVKLLEERPSKDGSPSKYYSVASRKLTLTTDSDMKYLASMHYVDYDAAPNARNLAKTLVASAKATGTDEAVVKARVEAVYNRLVKTMKYDYENYGKLAAYYVPEIDRVLARKLGVCYDQATLLVGMLRAEGIYAKVCKGTAKGVNGYHAWAQVKVDKNRWLTIDLTMDAQMEEFNMSYTMEKADAGYNVTGSY